MVQVKNGKKKPGAQRGNKNAEKHGFYSKNFTADEAKRIGAADALAVTDEIELLRVYLDRLASQIDMDAVYLQSKDADGLPVQSQIRDDHYLKQLNTMSNIAQSIATLTRTHHLTRGKGGQVEQTILEALAELALEMKL